MDFYQRVGARLRAFRLRAGLSQAALGARLGLTAGAINRYEMGRRRIPLRDVPRVASILGVASTALLGAAAAGGGGRRRPATEVREEPPAYGRRRLRRGTDARAYAKSLPAARLRALARLAGLGPRPDSNALRRYAELIAKDFARGGGRRGGRRK